MFHGNTCGDSQRMLDALRERPLPTDIELEKRETWENIDNAELLKKEYSGLLIKACERDKITPPRDTIVPSFVDPKSMTAICNPSYERLLQWLDES